MLTWHDGSVPKIECVIAGLKYCFYRPVPPLKARQLWQQSTTSIQGQVRKLEAFHATVKALLLASKSRMI